MLRDVAPWTVAWLPGNRTLARARDATASKSGCSCVTIRRMGASSPDRYRTRPHILKRHVYDPAAVRQVRALPHSCVASAAAALEETGQAQRPRAVVLDGEPYRGAVREVELQRTASGVEGQAHVSALTDAD